jgi:hypothetical protein
MIPAVMFHWLLSENDKDQAWEDVINFADLSLTVFTFGSYAGVKTAVKMGTKVTISMTIDFVCQAAIISLNPEKDFTSIKYSDVAWSGASSVISNPYLSTAISTVRTGVFNAMSSDVEGFEEKLLVGVKAARIELIVGLITHGMVGNKSYLALLEKTFDSNPRGVFDNLRSMNISPKIIQAITGQFVSTSLKETINIYIDEENGK